MNQYYSKTFILIEDKSSLFVHQNVTNVSFSFRFERISSTVDSLLFVQESEIARPRDRSQSAENRRQEMKMNHTDTQMKNHTDTQRKKVIDTQMKMKKVSATARERAFENSTLRQLSRFERVLIETTTSDEMMNTKTALAVHRADLASGRGRRRGREREKRERRKGRERREREQAVSE